ncbi:hypothetical protein BKA70DRAFT_1433921 [Coprinopsis sp. MPI-PUGE-AT-0042]|nr:hypothetical protein BKA70DRAFT_1433921 [Coprinopsis sp. MPI-PUGE-AT-0042]
MSDGATFTMATIDSEFSKPDAGSPSSSSSPPSAPAALSPPSAPAALSPPTSAGASSPPPTSGAASPLPPATSGALSHPPPVTSAPALSTPMSAAEPFASPLSSTSNHPSHSTASSAPTSSAVSFAPPAASAALVSSPPSTSNPSPSSKPDFSPALLSTSTSPLPDPATLSSPAAPPVNHGGFSTFGMSGPNLFKSPPNTDMEDDLDDALSPSAAQAASSAPHAAAALKSSHDVIKLSRLDTLSMLASVQPVAVPPSSATSHPATNTSSSQPIPSIPSGAIIPMPEPQPTHILNATPAPLHMSADHQRPAASHVVVESATNLQTTYASVRLISSPAASAVHSYTDARRGDPVVIIHKVVAWSSRIFHNVVAWAGQMILHKVLQKQASFKQKDLPTSIALAAANPNPINHCHRPSTGWFEVRH